MSKRPQEHQDLQRTGVLGIHHVSLSVRDVEAAAEFYQATTSMQRLQAPSIAGEQLVTPERSAVIKAPNGFIELMQFKDNAGPQGPAALAVEGPGITHVCYQSPAQLELYRRFEGANARPVSRGNPPVDLNGRGVVYAYARDADNIMFEVEQLDEPRFKGPIWLAHVALVSHDIDRLVDFYRDLLGVEPYGRANKLGGPRWDEVTGLDGVRVRAAWFNTGNMVLELWQYLSPATPVPGEALPFTGIGYNKIAIEVGDLADECARLARNGVVLLDAPVEKNGVTEACLRDPDGNLLSLLQAGPSAIASVINLAKIDWLPSPAAPDSSSG